MKAQAIIRDWTKREGRKLGWLAAQIPVTQSTLTAWLSGKTMPSLPARARIGEVIGADVMHDADWRSPDA